MLPVLDIYIPVYRQNICVRMYMNMFISMRVSQMKTLNILSRNLLNTKGKQ